MLDQSDHIASYPKHHMRTMQGRCIDLLNPNPDNILIEDIAHALSMQCRFNGMIRQFYSVAQHCVLAAEMFGLLDLSDDEKLAVLLHDASEAYLGDVISPLKGLVTGYKEVESNFMSIIAGKFGFEYPLSKKVKLADMMILEVEWRSLVLGVEMKISGWCPDKAKMRFLNSFKVYTQLRNA